MKRPRKDSLHTYIEREEREDSHFHSVHEFSHRFVFMCPRLLEMLKRFHAGPNNQTLPKKKYNDVVTNAMSKEMRLREINGAFYYL